MKVGDQVIRMLGGSIPVKVIILSIEENVITVGSAESLEEQERKIRQGAAFVGTKIEKFIPPTWKFNAATLGEIDEDLEWDGFTTGSYLVPNADN